MLLELSYSACSDFILETADCQCEITNEVQSLVGRLFATLV